MDCKHIRLQVNDFIIEEIKHIQCAFTHAGITGDDGIRLFNAQGLAGCGGGGNHSRSTDGYVFILQHIISYGEFVAVVFTGAVGQGHILNWYGTY